VGRSFCYGCGTETSAVAEICVKCGAKLGKGVATGEISPKSRTATTLLAFFLGGLGIHRFYTGKIGSAVAMLVLWILGIATVWVFFVGLVFLIPVSIWALVDFIIAVSGNAKDSDGKLITNW
jgi:TM2 domain-containing membrane protein YozV